MPVREAELASLRGAWERHMPDTLQMRTYTDTSDNAGGTTRVAALSDPIPCFVAPLGAGNSGSPETELAGRMGLVEAWIVTVPQGTDITEQQEVVVNGSRTMQVSSVLSPRSFEQATRVLCQEMG